MERPAALPAPPLPSPGEPPRPAIYQRLLPESQVNYGSTVPRLGRRIRFIVNHVAVGNGSLYGWFKTSGLSTQYWVSKAGVTEQYVEDHLAAYGQGIVSEGSDFPPEYPGRGDLYNCMALSIEREGYQYEEPPPAQWAALVALNRWLAWRHSVPVDRDHIVGHYRSDWRNRAQCPHVSAEAYMQRLIESVLS